MSYDVDVCSLSEEFYRAYPECEYPEILRKSGRPYTCLLIHSHDGYLICIPFRSSIKHNEAFLFSKTNRSRRTRSGLDYKKVVLIKNASYINSSNAIVDADEYRMMMINIEKIVEGIHSYISMYISHKKNINVIHSREYKRKYEFSTLPYFHDILDIT